MREDYYFQESPDIKQVPSAETLRQRFDGDADMLRESAQESSINLLKNADVPITPLENRSYDRHRLLNHYRRGAFF